MRESRQQRYAAAAVSRRVDDVLPSKRASRRAHTTAFRTLGYRTAKAAGRGIMLASELALEHPGQTPNVADPATDSAATCSPGRGRRRLGLWHTLLLAGLLLGSLVTAPAARAAETEI